MTSKERKFLKRLKKETLDIWSSSIKKGGYCQKCQSIEKKLGAHHLLSKKRYTLYLFEPMNGLALCWGCHRYFAHLESVAFALWLKDAWPQKYMWCCDHIDNTEKKQWTEEELKKIQRSLS